MKTKTHPPAAPAKPSLDDVQPILKWAGGKGRLLSQYQPFLPTCFQAYFEPFVGGGAMFFEMSRRGLLRTGHPPRLSDVNEELINLYKVVQREPQALIERLGALADEHSEEHFYEVRAWDLSEMDEVQRAARCVYLNKTCYNGLYRVNSKGLFNVPFGRYKNPNILNEHRILAAHQALQGVELDVSPYSTVTQKAKKGDWVYFDPPYQPLSSSSNFTSYARSSFGEQQQKELADLFAELDGRGVLVLLSNSEAPLVREIYNQFPIHMVSAPRFINSKADKRGALVELLVVGKHLARQLKL